MSSFFKRHKPVDEPNPDDDNDDNIDPELRLRTVRTAASAIAESIKSEQRAERRKSRHRGFFRRHAPPKKPPKPVPSPDALVPSKVLGARRNIYVNHPLSAMEVDRDGEPTARYVRNKVRTTKYTLLTFVPKNLYEQFRRVANLFFLSLVILQLFPIFGAAAGSIAVFPLAFILVVTAIKDGVEDYRRGTLDEQVNTSAATKLGGGWRNLNQPTDPRNWFQKLLGLNPPGRVTKGVRRLRDREAGEAGQGIRLVLSKGADDSSSVLTHDVSQSSLDLRGAGGRRLEDIQSVDEHSYPPVSLPEAASTTESATQAASREWGQFGSLSQYQQSIRSHTGIGVVDWKKHPAGSARWERTLWKKLEVGDIVLLRDNDQVPADIVVLSTSDPDGLCYLETKNLDGETNLKPRRSLKATSNIISEEDVEKSSFYLDTEPPHQNLYSFHGVLRYRDPVTEEERQDTVTINDLLLRGCAVRNTAWIIGLVVFTGADTKIMLNGGDTPSKRSKIEKETNFNVIVNFCVLTIMCLVAAVCSGVAHAKVDRSATYFEINSDPTNSIIVTALITFVSCLIALQNIVPISLYISIEIVKTIQAYFISQDLDMYYKPFDTACVPKTWNISDDLGQIEYIFSDKTGTLTQNIMEFQKCSIHGVAYGEGVTEAQRGAATRQGKADALDPHELQEKMASLKQQMIAIMQRTFKNRYFQVDQLTLISPKFAEDLADRSSEQRARAIAFFRALALCHSVLADRPEPTTDPYLINYKAESPDEAALVAAARDAGFPFLGKSKDTLEIEVMGQSEKYTLLKLLEFNSTRKRMSVVVRAPDGRVMLYCKGADSVIYERLAKEHDEGVKAETTRDLDMFANSGLRTLCISYRYVEEEEYLAWSRIYDSATSAVENREEEIEKANEMIEHSLFVLGATALEDKLQEGVPEAIELLHRAGIKLWILTGDKLQTAIEIGYSCNLLKQNMDVMILSASSPEQARAQIEAGLNKIASVLGPPSLDPRKRGFLPGAQAAFAVVIDGETLRYALAEELKPLFLNLGTQCETVVCCRVSPAQKALTVNLVKEGRNAMTLSIGDGANDVAMIQEANIGCGLFGLEGSQAAMSADYAFGQFRFLSKLLLVHGRWSYQRIADMHANFFYKNVIWTFALFWFIPFNEFDATYLFQYTFILLYNLLFTALPVIVLGAFDQDINAKAALAFPQLYVRGIRGLEYTRGKFWMYMFDGFYQSLVVYFVPYAAQTNGFPISWTGRDVNSLADFGTTVAVSAIAAANAYVGLNTHYWTVMTWIVVLGSTLVMMLWVVLYSFFPVSSVLPSNFVDEVSILFGTVSFWATVLVTVCICLAPRFIVKYWKAVYYPLDKDIVREMWVEGNLKDQLGLKHHKARRNRRTSGSPLESTPIFSEQTNRSLSELENSHDPFDAAHQGGSTIPADPIAAATINVSPPPMSQVADPTRAEHLPYMASSYDPLGAARPQPTTTAAAVQDIEYTTGGSPHYSLYSLPSSFPSSPNRAPSPLQKPDIAASSTTPSATMPMPSPPPTITTTTTSFLAPPANFGQSSPTLSTYEMRVRASPHQHDLRDHHPSASDSLAVRRAPSEMSHTSSASFATANDEFEDEARAPSRVGLQQQHSPIHGSGSGGGGGGAVEPKADEDDRSTLQEDRRRSKQFVDSITWEGATAM